MAELPDLHNLRTFELRLLRCSLPRPSSSIRRLHHHSSHPLINELISLIESGRYIDSLPSAATRTVFQFPHSSDPAQFYAELERAVETYLLNFQNNEKTDDSFRFMVVVSVAVAVAVAALLAFFQSNFTGPVIELPLCPLPWIEINEAKEWEAWAQTQLMSAGSDLAAKFSNLQGSEVWKDLARFRKYAQASLELCNVYLEISSSTGSLRELNAAVMHLRNTIKQACSFTDTEEFKGLQVCLNDVQMRLKSNSASTA